MSFSLNHPTPSLNDNVNDNDNRLLLCKTTLL